MKEIICEAFYVMGELASALGVKNINQLPGCWEHAIDEHWRISVNAHTEAVKNSQGVAVRPFDCYVEFNGWPAGFFGPRSGSIVAGELANENTLIDAMKAAIKRTEKA